jgi:hypothetical protein
MRPGNVSSSNLSYKQLDDDHRAADRKADGEIEQAEIPPAHPKAERNEKGEAQRRAQRKLQDAGDQHRLAGRQQLVEVELQPDDEEQQDQADLRHGLDAFLVADETQADLRDR